MSHDSKPSMRRLTFPLTAILAWALLLSVLAINPSALLTLFLHFRSLFLGFLPLLSFWGVSERIVARLFEEDDSLSAVERGAYIALGSFLLAAAFVFILLTLGIAYPLVLMATSGALLFWDRWRWINRIQWALESLGTRPLPEIPRVEFVLILTACALAGAVALVPPLGYDAHEYHLAVPEIYLREGAWVAFPYNVYAAFPMNVDLLYMWPLANSSAAGCTAVNFSLALVALAATYALGLRWGLGRWAWFAAANFMGMGLTLRLVLQANIDLGLTAGAAVLLLAYERLRERPCLGDGAILAAALGFSLGSKYVAAVAIVAPFAVAVIADIWLNRRWELARPAAVAMAGGFLLCSPWLIRNAVLYGNPIYPLLTPLLGGEPPIFAETFKLAHAANIASPLDGLLDLGRVALNKSLGDATPLGFSPLWLLALPMLPWLKKEWSAFRGALFLLTAYLGWLYLTQRNDRFLAPALPLLALLPAWALAQISQERMRRAAHAGALALLISHLYLAGVVLLHAETVEYVTHPTLEEHYLRQRLPHYRAIEWLNDPPPGETRPVGLVLFIGEAQTYGARFTHIAPTVFNRHPLETGIPSETTHVLVNRSELNRLRNGYGPLGWGLGARLQVWLDQAVETQLKPVYDAYPESPGLVVVYEVLD